MIIALEMCYAVAHTPTPLPTATSTAPPLPTSTPTPEIRTPATITTTEALTQAQALNRTEDAEDDDDDDSDAIAIAMPQSKQDLLNPTNPATMLCTQNGGTVTFEKKPNGLQFGVCTFADNLQCEEWAMFSRQCPLGGVRVTGYTTAAARYCAITGGTFISANLGPPADGKETGRCRLKDGITCLAQDYFEGHCR